MQWFNKKFLFNRPKQIKADLTKRFSHSKKKHFFFSGFFFVLKMGNEIKILFSLRNRIFFSKGVKHGVKKQTETLLETPKKLLKKVSWHDACHVYLFILFFSLPLFFLGKRKMQSRPPIKIIIIIFKSGKSFSSFQD